MSKLWTNDGKLILDSSGRLVLCDDCPCTGTGTAYPTTPVVCGTTTKNVPTSLRGEIYDATGEFACLNGQALLYVHLLGTWRGATITPPGFSDPFDCWYGRTSSTGTFKYDSICDFSDILFPYSPHLYPCYFLTDVDLSFFCSGNNIIADTRLGAQAVNPATGTPELVVGLSTVFSSTVITGDGEGIQIDITNITIFGSSTFFTTPPSETMSILFTGA